MVHGWYALLGGLSFLVFPDFVASVLGFPPPTEVWMRVFGLEVAVLGFFYITAARNELVPYFKASIIGRTVFTFVLILLWVFGVAKWNVILVGVVDLFGSLWTGMALRSANPAND